jgi:hypothetical protein
MSFQPEGGICDGASAATRAPHRWTQSRGSHRLARICLASPALLVAWDCGLPCALAAHGIACHAHVSVCITGVCRLWLGLLRCSRQSLNKRVATFGPDVAAASTRRELYSTREDCPSSALRDFQDGKRKYPGVALRQSQSPRGSGPWNGSITLGITVGNERPRRWR